LCSENGRPTLGPLPLLAPRPCPVRCIPLFCYRSPGPALLRPLMLFPSPLPPPWAAHKAGSFPSTGIRAEVLPTPPEGPGGRPPLGRIPLLPFLLSFAKPCCPTRSVPIAEHATKLARGQGLPSFGARAHGGPAWGRVHKSGCPPPRPLFWWADALGGAPYLTSSFHYPSSACFAPLRLINTLSPLVGDLHWTAAFPHPTLPLSDRRPTARTLHQGRRYLVNVLQRATRGPSLSAWDSTQQFRCPRTGYPRKLVFTGRTPLTP